MPFLKCSLCAAWQATPEQRAKPAGLWRPCQRHAPATVVDLDPRASGPLPGTRAGWSLTSGDTGGCCEGDPLDRETVTVAPLATTAAKPIGGATLPRRTRP